MSVHDVEAAINALKNNQMIVLVDDESRENEGDIVAVAETITPAQLEFMARYGRGLICVSLPKERAQKLKLSPQTAINQSPYQTAFTITTSHKDVKEDSFESRANTIRALTQSTDANDFKTPGFVIPLQAHDAGVLGRRGQTEGSLDLARIAGKFPAGVICEILDDDGTMMRGQKLYDFCNEHSLPITSVEALAQYRRNEIYVRKGESRLIKTKFGEFLVQGFYDDGESTEHFALIMGELSDCPLVRIHSECLTGDILNSLRCDCGPQLEESLRRIQAEGSGVVIYLRQEGRGIGLSNKIKAYKLQDEGYDTVEANEALGFEADKRSFLTGSAILRSLKVDSIRLLTNNPRKVQSIELSGITIKERIGVIIPENEYNAHYFKTKREKLGHFI